MNRVLILVNITALIIGISYGLHGPILPIFAKNVIGATYSELGLIGLSNFIPYMFIPLFVGILLDRFNSGYLLALGVTINSASIYLLSIAQSVPEIMGFRMMTGVAHAFFGHHVRLLSLLKVLRKIESKISPGLQCFLLLGL